MNSAMQNFTSFNKTLAGNQNYDGLQSGSETFISFTPIRHKIKLLLHSARLEVTQIQEVQYRIDAFIVQIKDSSANFKTYEDFLKTHEIDIVEIIDTSFHSTLCQNCSEACHENCEPDEMTIIGDLVLQQCWMIKNEHCRQCAGKCSSKVHYHIKKTIKKSKKKIQDILDGIIVKYHQTSKATFNYHQKIISKEDVNKMLEHALKQKIEDIQQLCLKLCHICGGPDLSQELHVFIDQLERDKTSLTIIKASHLSSVLIHSLKDLLENSTLQISVNPTDRSKTNEEDMKGSVKVKKTMFLQQSIIIDSMELKELLIDELIQNQIPRNLRIPEAEETSTTLTLIRNKIKLLLHNARLEVTQIQEIQDQIDTYEIRIKYSNSNLETYEDFTKTHEIDTVQITDTSFHSTLCQNCSEACHENCDPDEITMIGDQVFQQCRVIKNEHCRQCVGKCSSTVHYHIKKTIKKSKRKIEDIITDIKIKYDTRSENNSYLQEITSKEGDRKILESALKQKTEGIKLLCVKLHQIYPQYDISKELHLFIDQLDRKSAMLTGINVKNQTSVLIRSLNDLHTAMLSDPQVFEKIVQQITTNHTEQSDKTDEDTEPREKAQNIPGWTAVDSDKMEDITVVEFDKCEESLDSNKSPKTDGTSIKSTQEILDANDMVKVLIIGETGSGKSTFINYLTNYFYNGNLKNLHVAIPSKFHPNVTEKFMHCENDIQNVTQSKTDNCNQYMFSTNSKQYLFIDTPGLSDTRGTQQDDKNIVKIIDSVENLGGLTAVMIVVNGTVSRLTINLQNVLTRLRGNLPDIIMDNVIIVLTNVTRHTASFSITALALNGNVYPYYMQNSAFSQDPTTWTPVALEAIQNDFDRSLNEIKNMLTTIDTFKEKSVVAFRTIKDIRNEIKIHLHQARLEVSQIQKLQDEINAFESFVKQCNNDLITYKDYTKEREIETTEIVNASFNSTLCQQCNQICHDHCQLNESTTIGTQIFYQCWAIENGYCRQCTGKCSYTAHYHAKKTIKKSKKKIQDILSSIKSKYDETFEEKQTYQQKITSNEHDRKTVERALKQKNEEIKQLCMRLRHICAGFDLTQELHVLINQLETEETMLRSIEAKHQADVFIRSLKDLCNSMTNESDLLSKTLPKMNIIDTEPSVDKQASRISTNLNSSSLLSQQKSNISVSGLPSESNDDVLAIIRSINKKKLAKNINEKKSNMIVESETYVDKNENDTTDESSDEMEQDHVEKKETHVLPTIILDNKDLQALSIGELIACYDSHKGRPETNHILLELEQRSLGKSIGPIKTPEAIAVLKASTQLYSALGITELMKEYERLKQCINDIIGLDIFKIIQVPPNILIDIAAVYMALQQNSSEESTHLIHQSENVSPNYSEYHSRFPQNAPLTESSMGTSSQLDPRFQLYYGREFMQQIHYQRYPHDHHNTYCSPIPFNPNDGLIVHHGPLYGHPANTSQSIQQSHILPDHNNKYSFSDNRGSPILSTSNSQPNTPRHSPFNFANSVDKHSKIDEMPTDRLISIFNDACARRNHELSNQCYNELKQRCYGNYSSLIREKQALFDEACRTYQNRTLKELEQNLLHTNQTIDQYLIEGDATYIDNIPSELIIEAAALNHLIGLTSSDIESIDK